MNQEAHQAYAFGDYVVNVANRELLVNGREVKVQNRVFDLLVYLLENRDRAVSRDELVEKVWAGRITTDAAMARVVMKARQAVADDASAQDVIKTVHGYGYRFVATVVPAAPTDEKTGDEAEFATSGQSHRGPLSIVFAPLFEKKLHWILIALLAAVLGYLIFDKYVPAAGQDDQVAKSAQAESRAAASPNPFGSRSIAVLPFVNRSDRPEDEFLTGGFHDDLLATISKIGSLKVISRTSVMEYRDTTKKIPQIARELGVANILEGGIQRSGNRVRINVQLIDAETDRHLWAETFDRELTAENIFATQSEISLIIADALQATLTPLEQARIEAIPTKNFEAYTAYLSGRQLMSSLNMAKLRQSVTEFEQAVSLDPDFALAWLGMADSYLNLVNYAGDESGKYLRASEFAINRALAIDDRIGEAYASLASLLRFQHQPEKAEAAYKKSIELSPNYALAYHRYAHFLRGNLLRLNEALDLAERAAELDPRSFAISGNLGLIYEEKGLYSRAEQQFQRLLEMGTNHGHTHSDLAFFYTFTISDFPRALEHAYRAIELNPEIGFWRRIPFLIYLELGDLKRAGDYLDQMREADPRVGLDEVLFHFYRNDPAEAMASVDASQYKHAQMGMVELALGNADGARQIYSAIAPDLLDPGQWPKLLSGSHKHACVISWILMHTGDEALGEQLLQESITFFDEQLVRVHEHVDHFWPDVCYLTAGDTERGLRAIEKRLERNDLYGWEFLRMPMYDLVRNEPRFQAAVRERNDRVSIQSDLIEEKNHPVN